MIKWTTVTKQISDLKTHPKNPRSMSDKQDKDLEASLEKFGTATVPTINKDGTILGGHQRIRLLHKRGETSVEVRVPSEQIPDADAEELLLRLNRNHGSWDSDMLANNWDADFLTDIGFNDWEVGEWDTDMADIENTTPHTEGITATIKVKCPSDSAEEVRELIDGLLGGRTDCEIS